MFVSVRFFYSPFFATRPMVYRDFVFRRMPATLRHCISKRSLCSTATNNQTRRNRSLNQEFKLCENRAEASHPIATTFGDEYPIEGEYSQPITEEEFHHVMRTTILSRLKETSNKAFYSDSLLRRCG